MIDVEQTAVDECRFRSAARRSGGGLARCGRPVERASAMVSIERCGGDERIAGSAAHRGRAFAGRAPARKLFQHQSGQRTQVAGGAPLGSPRGSAAAVAVKLAGKYRGACAGRLLGPGYRSVGEFLRRDIHRINDHRANGPYALSLRPAGLVSGYVVVLPESRGNAQAARPRAACLEHIAALGRQQQKAPVRDRLERFVEYYPSVMSTAGRRPTVVDMRYPNGFALRVAAASVTENKGKP